MDAIIIKTSEITATVDAILLKTQLKTASMDSYVVARHLLIASIDSILTKLGNTLTASLDALISDGTTVFGDNYRGFLINIGRLGMKM